MPDPNDLITALQRLLAGAATEADRSLLHSAVTTGVFVTGERAVALGGSASDVSIVTGDQIVFSFKGADAASALTALSSITPPRLHQVPPPPADFTGREDEQQELLAAIEHGGVTISGLRGLGGIGKTALGLKLVEHLKPRYPDAQFYLDLKGASAQPLTAAEALAHVVRAYHPAAKLPDSELELRGLYLSVLEGQRALLLMDNAASAEQVEPLIPPSSCVLMVTSRQHFTLPGLVAKNLDTLSTDDARNLLLTITPRISEWADEIAKLCGYLPLALRLAAGALAKYANLKPADYARRLQDAQQRLQLVEASISLSYELLSDVLKQLWRMLAVFPDSFADDAAAAVWEIELDQAQEALGELIAASLVQWDEASGRYRLHDLGRLFADSKLHASERTIGHIRYAAHYESVLAGADDFYQLGGAALIQGLTLFDLEYHNIQSAHTWVAAQDVDGSMDLARMIMCYPVNGAFVLGLRQPPREAIRWLESALSAARRLRERAYEAVALGHLGNAYTDLGEYEHAIQFQEQSLVLEREMGNRKGEACTLGGLGNIYTLMGENQRAIEFYEKGLAIMRETGDRRGESITLGNLGFVYANLRDPERSKELQEARLEIAREIGDRKGEGETLGNLGRVYAQLGDFDRALDLFDQRLGIAREIGDRKGEAIVLWNISLILAYRGKRSEAIEHAEQSLTIRELIEDRGARIVREQLAAWREEEDRA